MSINVKLEAFEGPLDLLLHLIEKNKVDIYDIPIAVICDQYMEYINELDTSDLDVASEFLVMAATLLDIKARMLLPVEVIEDEEFEDPRADLVERLIAHKLMKANAVQLRESHEEASYVFYKEESIPDEVKTYIPPVDIDNLLDGVTAARLAEAFRLALKRNEEKVDKVRSSFGQIKKETFRIYDKSKMIIGMAKKKGRFSFANLLDKSTGRAEMVVTFLAVLELVKMGRIAVTQESVGADIELEAVNTENISEEEVEIMTRDADE